MSHTGEKSPKGAGAAASPSLGKTGIIGNDPLSPGSTVLPNAAIGTRTSALAEPIDRNERERAEPQGRDSRTRRAIV